MKLYFSPGACSLSPHIVLREAGFEFELEQVNLATKKTKSGADFKTINPKGYVPALVLKDSQVLTEGPAIVQYLADQKSDKGLLPPAGTFERVRAQEWLNFISTEIHKGFSPLFNPKIPEEWKAMVRENLARRFDFLADHLKNKAYVLGERFSVADAYLFTTLRWSKSVNIDLSRWPALESYVGKIAERPAVRAALEAESSHK